jgi:hypothetical protein
MPSTIEKKNIEMGGGDMYLQTVGTAGDGTALGASKNASIDIATKLLTIECDQSTFAIEQMIIKNECKGEIELLESSVRNMVLAFGGNPADIVEDTVNHKWTYTIKTVLSAPPEFKLTFKIPRVRDNTKFIIFTFYRIQSSGGLKLTFQREKENTFKFSFIALADTTQTDNPVGTIVKEMIEGEYIPADKAADGNAPKTEADKVKSMLESETNVKEIKAK